MVWRVCLLALLMTLLSAAQEIHLKTRTLSVASSATGTLRARSQGPVHRLVIFDHPPGTQDIADLMEAGLKITAIVPDNAVMVYGIAPPGGLALSPEDKLSPALSASAEPQQVIVEYHADVPLTNHILMTAIRTELLALAARDEVAYIFPADPRLLTDVMIPCAGMLTIAGPVAQYAATVHGWNLDPDHVARLHYSLGAIDDTSQREILRALNEWSSHTSIIFDAATNPTGPHTIQIKFARGSHGDAYPFRSTATLAHTFYPVPVNAEPLAGDMHLNVDENWNTGADIDLYSVALHEAGHAIGLGHSDQPGDVMYPYYRRGLQLSENDIHNAQLLYGAINTANPLQLTINPVAPTSQTDTTSISGTLAGGVAPMGMQWQTDHARSGTVTPGPAGTWNVTGIPLVTGTNTITVSAFDSAHQTVTQSAVITRLQSTPVSGSSPIAIRLTSPASSVFSTNNATIALSGTATGGAGVSQVVWQTSAGITGTATGTGPWVATGVPLMTGTNTVIVRAIDAKGANSWLSLVVVRH